MNIEETQASLRRVSAKLQQTVNPSNNQRVGELFERILESFYSNVLRPGDTAIDIGASRGIHTVPMARAVGDTGRVLGFEPIPQVRALLTDAVRQAKVSHIVEIHPLALSNYSGSSQFTVVMDDIGYSGLKDRALPFEADKQTIEVPVDILDNYVADDARVTFIKADVEGGEFPALQGGIKTLEKHRPLVVFETGRAFSAQLYGYTKQDLFGFFQELGYELKDILGCRYLEEQWDQFGPWNLVAYPYEQGRTVADVLSIAIAENLIGFSWDARQGAES